MPSLSDPIQTLPDLYCSQSLYYTVGKLRAITSRVRSYPVSLKLLLIQHALIRPFRPRHYRYLYPAAENLRSPSYRFKGGHRLKIDI